VVVVEHPETDLRLMLRKQPMMDEVEVGEQYDQVLQEVVVLYVLEILQSCGLGPLGQLEQEVRVLRATQGRQCGAAVQEGPKEEGVWEVLVHPETLGEVWGPISWVCLV
jgi:hypothetical protein